MPVQQIVEAIVAFVKDHQSWAIPIAFLVAFGESIAFLSLVWPGTAILIGIAALIAASGVEIAVLWPAIIAAGLGGTVGYSISYWIGWYFKDNIAGIWPFRANPDLIPRGEEFFQKYGAWGVFFGHFFGPVRAVIPVVAGMFRMPQLAFQIANIASAFIWAAGVIAPAFFLVTFKTQVVQFLHDHWWVVLVLTILAFLNAIPTSIMAVPTLVLFILLGGLYLFATAETTPLLIEALTRAVAAGALGAWLGDLYVYWRGRSSRRQEFHTIWEDGWNKEAASRATRFILRWRALGMFRSKFHTTMRAFAPLAAGALGLSVVPFAIASALSAVLWAAVLLAPWPAWLGLKAWMGW